MMRKDLYNIDPLWGALCDFTKRIVGGYWDTYVPRNGLAQRIPGPNEPHEWVPLTRMKGTPVPLWWIRMRDDPSPFYRITESCRIVLEQTEFCQNNDNIYRESHTRWDWCEDIIWGEGFDYKTLIEWSECDDFYDKFGLFRKNNRFKLPSKPISELEFRKNACCYTLTRHGCDCGNLLSPKQHGRGSGPRGWQQGPAWINHQVADVNKECSVCISNNKFHFGDTAHLYENRCAYTRPRRTNHAMATDKFRVPYLVKKIPRKKRSVARKKNASKKASVQNRRVSKSPNQFRRY